MPQFLPQVKRNHETVGVEASLLKATRGAADDLGLVLDLGEEAGDVFICSQ